MKTLWVVIIGAMLTGAISWAGWTTMCISDSTPRFIFDAHVRESDKRFNAIQNRLEDKLDRIQEYLMNHNRGDND